MGVHKLTCVRGALKKRGCLSVFWYLGPITGNILYLLKEKFIGVFMSPVFPVFPTVTTVSWSQNTWRMITSILQYFKDYTWEYKHHMLIDNYLIS